MPSPVPSGRAPRFGRFVERRAAQGSGSPSARLMDAPRSFVVSATGTEAGAIKNPSGAHRSGGVQIGPIHPWRYKGVPPRAANASMHSGYSPRAVDKDCWFVPFIRRFLSSRRASFLAQGTRLLRSRTAAVNSVTREKCDARNPASCTHAAAVAWTCACVATIAEAGKRTVTVVPRPNSLTSVSEPPSTSAKR